MELKDSLRHFKLNLLGLYVTQFLPKIIEAFLW